MKSRTSHLIHLLVWLLVLTAYVGVTQAPGFLLSIPAGLGGIAADQEWSDYLTMKKHAA